ncbi:hypothetical protein SODALDRAFT_327135 [Sodiomyces alkalinus F11]|uniref:Uncharacterized protein n=1 Tax=Sodiomyces alkalinus (strain CBS 110278 / VKM F-3762 / F11) TaxID=1314773 RepID=A0A3N2Q869_SODAK|nr:hypothetical protein SODALDRAFT_327135 [Sodiomyces alkalinus F11]ROT42973.1 hypothetical protein SODALDRAFT_327135 [Sodiomyces alkalinus F11]
MTSWYEDHWDCERAGACSTVTVTQLGIDATVTDYDGFMNSMNSAYSTSGISFSGEHVFIFTSLYTYSGGSFTGYGVYDSQALTQAGYNVITEVHTTTTCPTSYTLPPSPTGSICSPHGDHCEFFFPAFFFLFFLLSSFSLPLQVSIPHYLTA